MERTFVLIKPDAIKRKLIGKIIQRFEDNGFIIIAMEMKRVDYDWYKQMYNHVPNPIYEFMCGFFVGKRLIGIVLERPNAIEIGRKLVNRIREDFGAENYENCIHASDSREAVDKEIELFFGINLW